MQLAEGATGTETCRVGGRLPRLAGTDAGCRLHLAKRLPHPGLPRHSVLRQRVLFSVVHPGRAGHGALLLRLLLSEVPVQESFLVGERTIPTNGRHAGQRVTVSIHMCVLFRSLFATKNTHKKKKVVFTALMPTSMQRRR